MNIFGLFFSFMIPGVLLGIMISAAVVQSAKGKRRKCGNVKHIEQGSVIDRGKLYIHSMEEDAVRIKTPALAAKAKNRNGLYICSVKGHKAA